MRYYFVVFLHLLNIPGIFQSLVSFLIVFMLEMLYSFPQIFNHLELGLAVLHQKLQVLQGRDDLLHKRSDLLCPMVVYQLLEFLLDSYVLICLTLESVTDLYLYLDPFIIFQLAKKFLQMF